MRLYELILPMVAVALIVVAVRWQFHRVIDKATSGDPSAAIPVSTPIYGPLCGVQNRNCEDLKVQPYFKMP